MIDHSALTDQVEFFDPPTETQKDRARRTVACLAARAMDHDGIPHSTAVELLRETLLMLGLHPSQDEEDAYLTGPAPLPTDTASMNLSLGYLS